MFWHPKGTRYKAPFVIVIEVPPHKRTLPLCKPRRFAPTTSDHFAYVELPYVVFVIKYCAFGIWPFKFYQPKSVQCGFRDKPLTGPLSDMYQPSWGNMHDGMVVCMGDCKWNKKFYWTLKGMTWAVLHRVWTSAFAHASSWQGPSTPVCTINKLVESSMPSIFWFSPPCTKLWVPPQKLSEKVCRPDQDVQNVVTTS